MAELNTTIVASELHPHCRMAGQLVCKDVGYALHCQDGADLWLEMDAIPLNLVECDVVIDGRRYGRDLIWVEAIGPLESA